MVISTEGGLVMFPISAGGSVKSYIGPDLKAVSLSQVITYPVLS